ncbi:MAG TPA: flagellar protein FlaG [Thermoleophilaceae bacterium]|nr:flagellar protein FlaG [Thermoleophilaceae bacterium]
MSFEVPPVSSSAPVAASPAARTDEPQAANRKDSVAVEVDMIPGSPPPELHDEIDAASKRVDELRADGREVHFSFDRESQRVEIQVRDLNGNVLRTIPPSKALHVVSGGKLD